MKKSIITFAFLLSFFIRAYCQIDSSAFIKGFACIFSLSTPENWIRDEVQNQDGIEVAFLPDTSALKNGHTFIYANSGTSDIDSVIKWDQNDFKIKHPKADYQRQQPILTHKGDSAIIFQILIKNEMYFEKIAYLKVPTGTIIIVQHSKTMDDFIKYSSQFEQIVQSCFWVSENHRHWILPGQH